MLRCPPTTIVLGRPDLLDYEKRKNGYRDIDAENINQQFARIAVGGPDGPPFGLERKVNHHPSEARKEEDLLESLTRQTEGTVMLSTNSDADAEEAGLYLLRDTAETDRSTENPTRSPESRSSPMKNEFDYGGFVEYPHSRNADTTLQQPSTFGPGDSSTPQAGHHVDTQRLRYRPLPRSPLYLSQNATSPEGRPTTGLTPRVVSRVATHNSPGIIFAQPPRRPPRSIPRDVWRVTTDNSPGHSPTPPPQRLPSRTTPRTLRHQTNSFSFDSSERASAAYEQERVISSSTDDTPAHSPEDTRLHDELLDSSLQSSRISSSTPILHGTNNDAATPEPEEEAHVDNRDFIFSSPGFSLPPPFSSVSRRTSNAESLPSTTNEHFTLTSTLQGDAGSPNRDELERDQANLGSSPIAATGEANESPSSGGRLGAFISRISRVASYRARSPLHLKISPTSSPPQTQTRQSSLIISPETPSRPYRVYNDNLSPETQPQTPANLPESRHQSRYHASYTEPVTRQAARLDSSSVTTTGRAGARGSVRRRRQPVYTPVRGGHRSGSPVGLREEGFEGLYGGRENGDEEQNWVDGVRFNNAGTRLWGERDARNNGEALRVTPEPEDWRVGRRD